MANALEFQVKVTGLAALEKRLRRLPRALQTAIWDEYKVIGEFAVKRARLNAPIKTGALRASLHVEGPVLNRASSRVRMAIGSDLLYALRWHEEPFKMGPISAKQPMTVEGGVGNKYISRVVRYWRKTWTKQLKRAAARAARD